MRFLDHPHLWEWCRGHGVALDASNHALDDPALPHRSRLVFAPRGPRGYEPAVAAALLDAIRPWDECLLWVTGWGVWPSSEDWPRYYALRGRHGERRSLDAAPGHLLAPEDADFSDLLLQVLESGWDALLLPVQGGRPPRVRVQLSHDGWAEVRADVPLALAVPGLEPEAA